MMGIENGHENGLRKERNQNNSLIFNTKKTSMKTVIKKFKRAENIEVNIPATIRGGNGLNKTTILESIAFVLTGKDINGKEFPELYDNRQDLHDAFADVTFFDDFGNTFQRIVKPKFSINRQGEEKISILRSTKCLKNGIECPDFADNFADFKKYGTDMIFSMKPDEQRNAFIELLKKELPDFDLNEKNAELKQLKRAQKTERDAIKFMNDNVILDVEVPEVTIDDSEYQSAILINNPEVVRRAKEDNEKRMKEYNDEYASRLKSKSDLEQLLVEKTFKLSSLNKELDHVYNSTPDLLCESETSSLENEIKQFEIELSQAKYYNSINEVFEDNMGNPIIKANIAKIKEIQDEVFFFDRKEKQGGCPLTNEYCEIAEKYQEKSEIVKFESDKEERIRLLKNSNRTTLLQIQGETNEKYIALKSKIDRLKSELEKEIAYNDKVEEKNKQTLSTFAKSKEDAINSIKRRISEIGNLSDIEIAISQASEAIEAIRTSGVELESVSYNQISPELIESHRLYELEVLAKTDAEAINRHNEKLRKEKELEKTAKKQTLFEIAERIAKIQQEITDYFANLADIVTKKFAGDHVIELKLQEYVITTDDYKDCFVILADKKEFPTSCNGAMVNNVKCQILNGLQKMAGYKGVTLFDNAEANTTTPLNTLDLNIVVASATNDKTLNIK